MNNHLSMPPGTVLGYRKNGQPIYVIAGGSGEGDGEGGSSTEGQGQGGTSDTQADNGENADGNRSGNTVTAGTTASADDHPDNGNAMAAVREDMRQERARRQAAEKELASVKDAQAKLQQALDADRVQREQQMDIIAKTMGWKPEDTPPDPEKLAAELKAAQERSQAEISQRDAAIRTSQVELAVLRSAGKHGANGDALLDSRSFMAKAGKLDPSSDSFGDDLAEAIREAVESGPQYRAAGSAGGGGSQGSSGSGSARKPPARSGGEHTAPGGQRQWTREEAASIAKSDPAALQKAINDGLLVSLGYHPQSGGR